MPDTRSDEEKMAAAGWSKTPPKSWCPQLAWWWSGLPLAPEPRPEVSGSKDYGWWKDIDPPVPPIFTGEKPYTVILIYPDYMSENYGSEFYGTHVCAFDPEGAVLAARREMSNGRPDELNNLTDAALVAIFAGWHDDLTQIAESGQTPEEPT